MRTLIIGSVCALGLGLCGCVQSVDAPMSPTFGQAVATMDTQIIPTHVSDQPPASSGEVGAAAIGRYQKDQVYKPETQSTADVGYGGSGGGSSGGGK
jgi:hypothetical protein